MINGELRESLEKKVENRMKEDTWNEPNLLRSMDTKGFPLNFQGIDAFHEVQMGGKKYARALVPSVGSLRRCQHASGDHVVPFTQWAS